MVDSPLIRVNKQTSLKLVMLKKMTGIPKCRLIEDALNNYIPIQNVKKTK